MKYIIEFHDLSHRDFDPITLKYDGPIPVPRIGETVIDGADRPRIVDDVEYTFSKKEISVFVTLKDPGQKESK